MSSNSPSTMADPEGEGPSLRLLIVEDEALVAMLIEDALTLHGHQVVAIADTAAEAIEIGRRERPDLALCDVKLADGDSGIAAAEALAGLGIACLFLSGNCPPSGGDPRIIGCLPKPFHTATVGQAVRAAHAIACGDVAPRLPTGMVVYGAARG
ncbi:response regulator [Sphingomonas morindae]|uniref:Response regulator n=1 Tax=Sphingomonas morindae TaxID=1541170 RepID=A0ABY4XB36_9SPHN|nr:response regulator [Sphingomonas morindae]USI74100.1 response regulator [Sphingomonas morindae]